MGCTGYEAIPTHRLLSEVVRPKKPLPGFRIGESMAAPLEGRKAGPPDADTNSAGDRAVIGCQTRVNEPLATFAEIAHPDMIAMLGLCIGRPHARARTCWSRLNACSTKSTRPRRVSSSTASQRPAFMVASRAPRTDHAVRRHNGSRAGCTMPANERLARAA